MYLSIDSDNLITLDDLQNTDGQLIDDAQVTARVLKYDGTLIVEGIALTNTGPGTGRYEGIMEEVDAAKLVENVSYDVEVTASRNAGEVVSVLKCRYQAQYQCN